MPINSTAMKRLLPVCILILASCAQIRVHTLGDPGVDFTSYQSWCWLQGCEITYDGPDYLYDSSTIETVANAVAFEMYQKGYKQEGDSADLFVDFHIVVKEDSAVFSMIHEEDLPFWNNSEQEYYHFLRGSLIIQIGDRRAGKMVWRSDTRRLMALRPDIEDNDIRKGVKKALKKFPTRDKSR